MLGRGPKQCPKQTLYSLPASLASKGFERATHFLADVLYPPPSRTDLGALKPIPSESTHPGGVGVGVVKKKFSLIHTCVCNGGLQIGAGGDTDRHIPPRVGSKVDCGDDERDGAAQRAVTGQGDC